MCLFAVPCNFIHCYYDSTCCTYMASSTLANFTKGCFAIGHYNHCKTICEISRYTALSNSVKHQCNTPYFSVSGLLQKRNPNQSGYGEIRSVTRTFYSVRQCSISVYFTYLSAVEASIFIVFMWA